MAPLIINKKGMVLAEILLAGAIISIAIGSVAILIGSMQSILVNTQNGFAAILKAREAISQANITDFLELNNYEKIEDIFKEKVTTSYINPFTLNISADISWGEGVWEKHRVLNSQIIDWRNSEGESNCDWLDSPVGNFSIVDSQILNADSGNMITDLVANVDYVYISADSATSSLPDLYVIDVHDIKNPWIVGFLNTGPGIASIAVAGHYIYAANAGSFQMQIIDVADPAHPILIKQAKLPGAIVSGSAGFGQSVHYHNKKMYLGLVKNTGPEFFIIDVRDPSVPITLGSFEIGSTVNDIDVQDNQAVAVTPGQNSAFLLDVSSPNSIKQIYSTSFIGWQTQGAQSVEMLGSNVAVGRSLGGFFSPYPELMIMDRHDFVSTSTVLKLNASIDDVLGLSNYLYLATSDPSRAFQIIKNNNELVASFDLPDRAVSLDCNYQAIFVASQSINNFLHIYAD